MLATLRIYRFKLPVIRSQARRNLKTRRDIIKHSQIVFFSRLQVILRNKCIQIIECHFSDILIALTLRIEFRSSVHCTLATYKVNKMVALQLRPELKAGPQIELYYHTI